MFEYIFNLVVELELFEAIAGMIPLYGIPLLDNRQYGCGVVQ